MPVVIMYTDGSCIRNPRGPGGWAALLREANAVAVASDRWRDKSVHGERCKILAESGESETTNQRMEVMAAIKGLQALTRPCSVTIRSDSEYLVNTMTPSLKWKRNANKDLWAELDQTRSRHQVTFEHVSGHSGDPWNDAVDRAANAAARARQRAG